MKVHLFKNRLNEEFKMQCGYKIHGFNIDFYETIDHTKVTCEVCKSTQAYKDLEAANESTKEILEDMNKIKDDSVAKFKQSESATIKECSNCAYMENDMCYHKVPDVIQYLSDGTRCCEWNANARREMFDSERLKLDNHNKAISKEDEAINLLNEVAEMFKLAELDTLAKLKVIDFIESRVRHGRL